MAGIEALGRILDVVPIASGVAISMRDCSAITFVCTGQDTFTLTVSPTFGGSYVSPGTIINHVYWSTATNGTAAWQKFALAATADHVHPGTDTGLTTANTTVIELLSQQVVDPNVYVKLTASAAGLVTAILHDLEYQRKPANLPVRSA